MSNIESHGLTPDVCGVEIIDPCLDIPSWRFTPSDTLCLDNSQEIISKTKQAVLVELPKNDLVTKAVNFAEEAHAGKIRKVSQRPYTVHPYDTAYILSRVSQDPNLIAASLLHDVDEDSPLDDEGNKIYSLETIRNEFNEDVAFYVEKLTSDETKGEIPIPGTEEYYFFWRNKKQTALDKVITSDKATVIKTADLLSNVHDFLCDRVLVDADGKMLGNRVFDNFSVSQHAILGRFTYSAILLSNEYRKITGQENPISNSLLSKVKLLIQNSLASAIDDQNSQTLVSLYSDWIRALDRENKEVLKGLFVAS